MIDLKHIKLFGYAILVLKKHAFQTNIFCPELNTGLPVVSLKFAVTMGCDQTCCFCSNMLLAGVCLCLAHILEAPCPDGILGVHCPCTPSVTHKYCNQVL